jgi:hypothetical protein
MNKKQIEKEEKLEPIRDEVEKVLSQAERTWALKHGLADKSTFNSRDLGIERQIVVEQARDNGIMGFDIQKAIDKVARPEKPSKAKLYVSKVLSKGFYDYLKLRRILGVPKDSFTIGTLKGGNLLPDCMGLVNPGGLVWTKEGSYSITNTLIMNSNVSLNGASREATILSGTVNPLIQWAAKDFVSVKDLTINGTNKSGDGMKILGSAGTGSNYFLNDNLLIKNCVNGLYLDLVGESVVRNIRVYNCTNGLWLNNNVINTLFSDINLNTISSYGVRITSSTQRCEGEYFIGGSIFNVGTAFYIDDGYVIVFDGFIFDFISGDGGGNAGIIYGGKQIIFENSYIYSTNTTNSRVAVAPAARDLTGVKFTKCIFAALSYYGLLIDYDSASGRRPSDIKVSSCRFEGNGLASDGGDIFIRNADKVRIVDNELLSTTPPYNLAELNSPSDIWLIRNTFAKGASGQLLVAGANRFHQNKGYVTENSGSSTGTGAQQTIAHGLASGLTPNNVTIVPTATGATVSNVWADATNIYCTVKNGAAFKWSASVI